MMGWYARWIDRWETELATRDTNRKVRPFEWGLEWLQGLQSNGDPHHAMESYLGRVLADSDQFFNYDRVRDYRLDNGLLSFPSPVVTPYPENNTVYGGFYPVTGNKKRAVVVLPQWNSDIKGHVGLCKLLNKFGITALRMSMAYHDRRMPAELERADYHMSSNIGRTISAVRQSAVDVRCCLDWLERQGYERLGILGTSLGSCVAFITAAHEPRLTAGVFNHVSMNVGDVVWTGLSTQHIRQGIEPELSLEQLRRYWAPISPSSYMEQMEQRQLPSLLVWAVYDTSFLPELSRQVLSIFKKKRLPHEVFTLPCAHYTTGQFPFNLMDGLAMAQFLYRKL
jgi:hypothetical protein